MTIPSLEIRPLNAGDQHQFAWGVRLLNITQGDGIFRPDYLAKLVGNSAALVVGVFDQGKIVGIGTAQIITEFSYYRLFNPNIDQELSGKKVGSFSTLGILEEYRGQGLGQKIGRVRLEWLRLQGCDVVVGVSWRSGLAHTSDRVFRKLGFRSVKCVDGFYLKETHFVCPACKAPPCRCAAEMFQMSLRPCVS